MTRALSPFVAARQIVTVGSASSCGASSVPSVRGIRGPYRFFFYSFDCNEPRHVHVRRERKTCKYWLEPVSLAYNNRFTAKELNRIRKIILANLELILEAWDEHCGE
jgi:hypothetical protein